MKHRRHKLTVEGETPTKLRREVESIGKAIDELIDASGIDLAGKRIRNAAEAIDSNEYVTLAQVMRMLAEAPRPASAFRASSATGSDVHEREVLNLFDDLAGAGLYNLVHTGSANNSINYGIKGRPGIMELSTGTTSGSASKLRLLGSDTGTIIIPSDIERVEFAIDPVLSVTNRAFFCFGCDDMSVTTGGTRAIGFRYNTAVDSSVRAVCRSASVETSVVVVPTLAATTWYKFAFAITDAGVEFYVNNELKTVISTNVPNLALNIGIRSVNSAAEDKRLQIDYIYLRSIGMERI